MMHLRIARSIKLYAFILAILVISIIQVRPLGSFGQTESVNSVIYPPDSKPYGKTYADWTAEWWEWFISIPTDKNPINDPTGERCDEQQVAPVWFLVGSGGGKAERTCTIPTGKAILIPAIDVECSFAEDQSLKTEQDLRACAKDDQDKVQKVYATIDGTHLPTEQIYRVQSLFNVSFGSNNVFSAPEGTSQSASDGYWLFLKPLSPGQHEIHVGGLMIDYTETGPSNFIEDSTYHLTVEGQGPTYTVFEENVTLANKTFALPLNSSSTISDLNFDEKAKRVSFKVSGEDGTEGITIIPISQLLVGPYTVTIDGKPTINFETIQNQTGGSTYIKLTYVHSIHEITITGTNVVPEFPYLSLFILLSIIGSIIVLGRTGLINNDKI